MHQNNFQNLFSLKNKTAIVTGGAGILGKHFCSGLAAFGANVVIVDINEKDAVALAADIEKNYSTKAIGIACDVANEKDLSSMVQHVMDKFKSIDVLHNNAATKSKDLNAFFAPFEDYSLEEWRKIASVNLDGMMLTAKIVGREIAKNAHGGSIIQTASIAGFLGPDPRIYEGSHYLGRAINTPAVYSTTKGAVIALTKYLATYWAPKRIRVNSISPGGVESGQNETFKSKYSARVPLGRMARASEIVGALIYLASDASSYVTGQNIVVDGGLSAW